MRFKVYIPKKALRIDSYPPDCLRSHWFSVEGFHFPILRFKVKKVKIHILNQGNVH